MSEQEDAAVVFTEDDFAKMTVFKRFEGGTVYTFDTDTQFLVVVDESTMAFLLEEESDDMEFIKCTAFATAEARLAYLQAKYPSGENDYPDF
ncbi:hypothetical protein JAO78_000085 [Alishewanella sp. 16-MA]|uniref:Uncharacterized protein n=1 Tax=Alishewanella maricola TaxID=2795740 RepID=A0ABS8BYS6_9ALTE|nr:hypothetical protein [Alishewanella maricola]MCB5225214.1 hypothetical protein [Alishewanella maricola]